MVRVLLFVGKTKERVPVERVEILPTLAEYSACFQSRNITGALIYCGGYLANYIEGSEDVIRKALEDSEESCQHFSATLMLDEETPDPKFSKWSLVHAGDTEFVSARVKALHDGIADDADRYKKAHEVIQMMTLFA